MKVIRTYVPDSFANYNHLVYCEHTNQAAAVDPFDADHLTALASENGLKITQIWITHEHGDHIRDAEKLKAMTHAQIVAPVTCRSTVSADLYLDNSSDVQIGDCTLSLFLTPGHTPGHCVYLYQNSDQPEQDFIIAGDTLFNAGIGNINSGNIDELYQSIEFLKSRLAPETSLYCGHDYIETNLRFTLNHVPANAAAQKTLDVVKEQTPDTRAVQTWQQELEYNLFLRLDCEEVAEITDHGSSPLERFTQLRHLRDRW